MAQRLALGNRCHCVGALVVGALVGIHVGALVVGALVGIHVGALVVGALFFVTHLEYTLLWLLVPTVRLVTSTHTEYTLEHICIHSHLQPRGTYSCDH